MLRTFSKIYGLAGLRVGYAVAPRASAPRWRRCAARSTSRSPRRSLRSRASATSAELARRRAVNAEGLARLESLLREHGLAPVPSVGNFLYVDTGGDANVLYERLLHEGVIVRPLAGFGSTDRDPRLRRHARRARLLRGRARAGAAAGLIASCAPLAQPPDGDAAHRAAASACSSSRRSAPAIGTWMATIALTADVKDAYGLAVVGERALHRHLPAVGDRRTRRRPADRPALAQAADRRRRRRAASASSSRCRSSAARSRSSRSRPSPASRTRSSGRPCSPGVPNLVAEEELAHGTSLLQATDWAAATLGPILGGVIVSASGPDLVYWINAATFLLSVLLLLRIPARLLQSEQAITRGHWRDLADGLARVPALGGDARPRSSRSASRCSRRGLINVSEIFLAERALHRGAFGYGLLWTATGARARDRQPRQRRPARASRT